jgi:hypothetical protein
VLAIGTQGNPNQLRVPGAQPMEIETEAGEVLITREGGVQERVPAGTVIDAGSVRLRVTRVGREAPKRTIRPSFGEGYYHLDANVGGRTPWAEISDGKGLSLEVEGETRATLLSVLGTAVLSDREKGVGPTTEGWVDDEFAVGRVWGRTNSGDVSNRLSVVVYRLRTDLKKAGLDPKFIERSRGRISLDG